ncbi:DUF1704 domain-containing protein [Candidatus Woesearchaeota archaeon]|nr:DUF1704 domain-containing protein [Candidatus Woesearchaeota archaeon]
MADDSMLQQRLLDIDRQLHAVDRLLLSHYINPINEKEEKKKFLSDAAYDPQFRYQPLLFNPAYAADDVRKILIGSSRAEAVFKKKAESILLHLQLLARRGTPLFPEISFRLFGKPSQQLIGIAMLYARLKVNDDMVCELKSADVKALFKSAFFKYGFHWDIDERDMPARAYVSSHEKKLYLQRGACFSKAFVKKLIVHEVATHILRAENGAKQPYKIFSSGLAGYLMTEEGLAVYNEAANNVNTAKELKAYGGRVLAVHYALRGSFRETYRQLLQYFPEDAAWQLTVRVKRGLGDTSRPGAFTKDIVYLKGYLAMLDYAQKGSDVDVLYYGKVGLDDIPYLKDIPGLIHPRFLPLFQSFDFFLKTIESGLLLDIKFLSKPLLTPLEMTRDGLKKLFGKW